MSDYIPRPTENLLVKELKDVTNWYVFGVALGIPVSELDRIKKENSDVEEQKIKMFQFWLQYNVGASWKIVIQTLEQINYLTLASRLSRKYLSDSSTTSGLTSTEADEIQVNVTVKDEIQANVTVLERLRDLEISFATMLSNLLELLKKYECDFSKARFFLNTLFKSEFSQCNGFDALLHKLHERHMDTFNIYYLEALVAHLENKKLKEPIEKYKTKMEQFFKDTTVLEFQQAVVSRVEPVKPSQMKDLTIKVSKRLAEDQTLEDMKELALSSLGDSLRSFVRIHMKSGSVIISWFFPEALCGKLEHLARKKAANAVFKDAGVEEVTVGGRIVFPSTLEEDIPTASLKEIYTDFYHRLVEAVSDEHTCQSLLTQLSSPALISEEKIAQLTSSKVTGNSFLKTLGLEEEPYQIDVLIKSMSGVEQLQTLASEISAVLKSKQEAADTLLHMRIEQQLKTEIEQLKTANNELLAEVKLHKDKLTKANELLIMREKVLSAMLARARDTDPKLREERGRHLEEKQQRKSHSKLQIVPMDLKDDSLQKGIIDLSNIPDGLLDPFLRDDHYHLPELVKSLSTVSHWWYPLGILLGLSCTALKIIERECSGMVERCLIKMLMKWLHGNIECNKQLLQNALNQLTPQLVYLSNTSAQQTISIADLSKVPDGTLDQTHLLVLMTALSSVSQWWLSLGIYLGLSYSSMEEIDADLAGQMESCRIKMLTLWLEGPEEKRTKQCLQNALKFLIHHVLSSRNTTAQQFGYCYPPPPYTRLEEPISIVDLSKFPDGTLDDYCLVYLHHLLAEVYQWFPLGMHLGLSRSELHDIEICNRSVYLCMIDMLHKWLEGPIEKRSKQCLQDALKQLTPQLVSLVYPPPTSEKPLVSMKEIQPLPVPQTDLERQAVNRFTKNVRVVIQTFDESEYYAALEKFDPPRIENYNYDKPVQYPHSELSIVVGTFAGVDAAIIAQGENFNAELETIFKDVFTSTKLLLGLGVCYGHAYNSVNIDLRIADVVVASEIGVSQLDSDGGDTCEEQVHKVAPSVYQLFCKNPNTWDGMVVCEEPNKRISKAHVGRLFGASRV